MTDPKTKAITGAELDRARSEMLYYKRIGGFGYKQAKRHYERLCRKARAKL